MYLKSHGRVTQRGVQSSSGFCVLHLSLREAFFVLGDSVNESKASLTLDRNTSPMVHPNSIFGLFSNSRWTLKSLLAAL
jgi:hypothetical protein